MVKLNWYVPLRVRKGPAGRLLTKLAPSWAASPGRRLVQTAFFGLFLWLFFHVAWPYDSTGRARLVQSTETVPAELFLTVDPLVSTSTALAARTWGWPLAWGAATLAICLVVPRFFCGHACPLGTLIDLFDWAVNRPARKILSLFRGRNRGSPSPPRRERGTVAVSPWRHFRYFLLAAVFVAAACGVALTGYVSPLPVVTRGLQYTVGLAELGGRRGWQQVPPLGPAVAVSVGFFAAILLSGLIRPRFWCRYVCPSGAMLSLVSRASLMRRRVSADCTACGRCRKVCSFDAVDADFAARVGECTFCQECGGVCPVGAIHFGATRETEDGKNREDGDNPRSPRREDEIIPGTSGPGGSLTKAASRVAGILPASAAAVSAAETPGKGTSREGGMPSPPSSAKGSEGRYAGEAPGRPLPRAGSFPVRAFSRRGFLCGVAAGGAVGLAGAAGVRFVCPGPAEPIVRPPGSVPEREFLCLCVRCGECLRVCPTNVLQPMGLSAGLEGLWTPAVVADWSGCEPTCNNCGQVCPTGAIRAISVEEKRATRMGLARVNEKTCLHCLGGSDCETVGREGHPSLLCRDACASAGHHAIDLVRLGVQMDAAGQPVEGSGYLAPVVSAQRCVGCGLCQSRCYKINVAQKRLLTASAIRVAAGAGKEDRLRAGSSLGRRGGAMGGESAPATAPATGPGGDYVTEF